MDWTQILGGAGGGAMAGSMFGPWGAGIGGLLGGVAGAFGNQGPSEYQNMLKQLAAGWGNMKAPQVGSTSTAGYSGFRQNQAGLIAQLEAQARGEGPSAASVQMKNAMDREAATQASAAAGAGGRGVNAGAALRQAMDNTAAAEQRTAQDTGLMRVNEQLGAEQQLGGVINQGRAADEGINEFNAGATNQTNQFNVEAQLKQLGITSRDQLEALMAAMGVQGPGTGMQLLAGGAQMMPGLMQARQQQAHMQWLRSQGGGGYSPGTWGTANPATPAYGSGPEGGTGLGD